MKRNARQNDVTPTLPMITAEWQKWKKIVQASPAIREHKIASSRQSMGDGAYDELSVLDETLNRMILDMGVRFHD